MVNYQVYIPQAYIEVLQKYYMITNNRTLYSFEEKYNNGEFDIKPLTPELEYKWKAMIVDINNNHNNLSHNSFGYILKDINCDFVEELFLVRNDHTLLAVFTMLDNKPLLLDAFWSKNKGFILDTNEIYVLTTSGAQDFEYAIKKFNVSGTSFVTERSFGCKHGIFYQNANNQERIISVDEFESLVALHPLKNGTEWNENPISQYRGNTD